VAAASVNLRELSRRVETIPRSGMITVARAAKKIVDDEGRRVAGPDGMKGKKKRGLKLRARDDIRDTATGARCRVQGSVPAWIWADSGTAAHPIRRRKRGPMRKYTVPHPGTPARHAWRRVAERIADAAPLIFADEVHRVMR
jgi:hypothetical protein